jgi:hypothetical protein
VNSAGNLYNTRLGKVTWFVRRFGAAELVRKPLRSLLAPFIIPRLPKRTFRFQGADLGYFYHPYNMTWATERCLEVPVARSYAAGFDPADTLEVGNVLSHYAPVAHTVLDKFERGRGIINQDIVEFCPGRTFRFILSISTFEHIGFDDEISGSSGDRILEAIRASRQLLDASGLLVITVPIGYNPDLDALLAAGRLPLVREFYFQRSGKQTWQQADKLEVLKSRYAAPYPYANGVLVAEIRTS